MATFGQGINAQLGAIDYSAYQRGAAQGAQSIGQGLANLGQEVGAGLKKRGEYKNNVTSAKKLIAGLNTLNIPEEVKTQMGVLGAQIDDPNISLSEQSAIATRLSSLADGIVGAGLKQSFEDAKNKRISDAINAATTKQTPEQSIDSFKATLAGKTEPAFQPRVDMSQLGALINSGMSVAEITALSNARSNAIIAEGKQVPKASFKTTVVEEMRNGKPTKVTYNQQGQQIASVPIRPQPANISFGGLAEGSVGKYDPDTGTFSIQQIGTNTKAEEKEKAKVNTDKLLDDLTGRYEELNRLNAIRDSSKSAGSNIVNYLAASGFGQEFQKMYGSKEQTIRDEINQAVPILIQDFAKSTGMTGTQLNSDADIKLLEGAVGNASADIGVALTTMRRLRERIGGGAKPKSRFEIVEE